MELLDGIDHTALQQKLLSTIQRCLKKGENMKFEDTQIISNSLNLWVCLLTHEKDLFQVFLKDDKIDSEQFLLSGILHCKDEEIRETFRQSLIALSQGRDSAPILVWLLQLCSSTFLEASKYESKQYFDLFIELIDAHFKHEHTEEGFKPNELLASIILKIQ
jgi:hypothetical protein